MMDTELFIRTCTNNNGGGGGSLMGNVKPWSASSIPTLGSLECLEEGSTLGGNVTPPRRESAGGVVPQARRDSTVQLVEEVKQRGRRKSWHPKLERKRRKGVIAPETPPNGTTTGANDKPPSRQKRPSWWNIFVPDHLKARSRRASQDIGHIVRSSDGPYVRSKSRSVDHGFSTPFDLEALRSKVEGRFESVDKLTKESDSEKKKIEPPVNTITYTVSDRDTLTSVAARFDTTPSELTKLNRLATPFIFAGQVLRVPDRSEKEGGTDSQSSTPTEPHHDNHDDLPPEEKELLDNLRPVSPKPGHIERVRTPLGGSSSTPVDPEDEAAFKERFLKINVRHITDGQGVVGGVLLVTPNAVMFDPNVSDPLVIEHGPESYGVIAPMEFAVNAAIYYDIAHMRVGNTDNNKTDTKPEIYHAQSLTTKSCGKCSPISGDSSSLLVKDETFPELVTGGDDADSICSCVDRGGDAFPKAFERELVTPTPSNLQQADSTESDGGTACSNITNTQSTRTLEERRRSMLDHHWAIPSKDRSLDESHEESLLTPTPTPQGSPAPMLGAEAVPDQGLVKLSCHDSGIDIRDPNLPPIPIVPPNPTKKVYSDADIVLSSDWVPPITIAPTNVTSTSNETDSPGRKKTSSVSFSVDSNNDPDASIVERKDGEKDDSEKQETRKNKMLKRLSYPLTWMETLAGGEDDNKVSGVPHSADAPHSSVFSKVFSRRSSVGAFIKQSQNNVPADGTRPGKPPVPRLDYRSMVSVDDMPELFVSFDKLIPRPARSCEDPPLYLRLRMGKPSSKPIPRSTPLMSYGKKKMRPEYWFSVPRNRVDDLYRFLQLWVPQRYGELSDDEIRERGFDPVESDTELWDDDSPGGRRDSGSRSASQDQDVSELTRESWEVLSRSEDLRRALHGFNGESLDVDLAPPDLIGTTEILTYEHREQLCRHLPARAEGYVWTLVFSTSQHGFSLNSMYRKMARLESPVLMVIQDTDNNVFGALTSCALKVSDHFYGTGESLLYRFTPQFQVYNWTGENLYFIKGNNESLSIGAGDGKFGIWLDGDLYQGRTEPCKTYGNEALSPNEDFVVKTLECWAFV